MDIKSQQQQSDTEPQSNTCKIIKIDKKSVNDIKNLKKKYMTIKQKILNEIIQELSDT